MKHTRIPPRVIERINAMRTGRRESAPASPQRIVGKHPALAMPYRRALRILEEVETTVGYGLPAKVPSVESVRGEIRDLLKARRERMIRNRKLGLYGD